MQMEDMKPVTQDYIPLNHPAIVGVQIDHILWQTLQHHIGLAENWRKVTVSVPENVIQNEEWRIAKASSHVDLLRVA